MLKIPFILLLLLLFSCGHKRSESGTNEAAIHSDTAIQQTGKAISTDRDSLPNGFPVSLKNNYSVILRVDDSTEFLYLRHNTTEKVIASCSRGLPYQNLGYVKADFSNCFVLMHSFGSGNPRYIELIEKRTAINKIPKGSVWIDADVPKGFLLYTDEPTPSMQNGMTLLNVITGRRYPAKFPLEIIQDPDLLNSMRISSVTKDLLVVSYNAKQGSKTDSLMLR
jgi:hypothetical protein